MDINYIVAGALIFLLGMSLGAIFGIAAVYVAARVARLARGIDNGRFPQDHTWNTSAGIEDAMAVIGRLRFEAIDSLGKVEAIAAYANQILAKTRQGPRSYDPNTPGNLGEAIKKRKDRLQ